MIFKINPINDSFVDKIQKESMDELNTFYGIGWVHHLPNIIIVDKREDIDSLYGDKTEDWLVGWTNKRTVYVLNKDNFGTESDRIYSDAEYIALIKHELSHIFFEILSKGNHKPIWLNEGLAIYTSGQLTFKKKPENFNHFLNHYENGGKAVYDESGFVVQLLIDRYGKEKLLQLISQLKSTKTEKEFLDLFRKIYRFTLCYENINTAPIKQEIVDEMSFTVSFSKEIEIQRLLSTKNDLEWFAKNGYDANRFPLPKEMSPEKLGAAKNSDIQIAVENDYDPEAYKPHEQTILNLLPNYLDTLSGSFSKIGIKVQPNIGIKLTKYGTGGSYTIPNVVLVNISNYYNIGLIRTILHEIIHLHIQHLIDAYKIRQWHKEAIVDCVFENIFPSLLKRQHYQEDVSKTQETFKKYYPDLDLIIETVSKETVR